MTNKNNHHHVGEEATVCQCKNQVEISSLCEEVQDLERTVNVMVGMYTGLQQNLTILDNTVRDLKTKVDSLVAEKTKEVEEPEGPPVGLEYYCDIAYSEDNSVRMYYFSQQLLSEPRCVFNTDDEDDAIPFLTTAGEFFFRFLSRHRDEMWVIIHSQCFYVCPRGEKVDSVYDKFERKLLYHLVYGNFPLKD